MSPRSSPRRANPSDNNLIEVIPALHAVRNLRAGLLDLAARLAEMDADATATLVLADPRVTDRRVQEEWSLAGRILRPELFQRMNLVVSRGGRLTGHPREPGQTVLARIERALMSEAAPATGLRLPRADTYPEILKILLARHLTGAGPVTADWLARTVGCNYRTVARAVGRLRPWLETRSDRRIGLRVFPREEWAGLVALGDRARTTLRYVDMSGQPRSPQFLIARLEKMARHDVAVAGTHGAAHHCPEIEAAGTRLDLSLHCPGNALDLAIVGRLDPAFKRTTDPSIPAVLVLHVVRRREPLFDAGEGGMRWADPAECLLDLHEARLEAQARRLVEWFEKRKGMPA